jgi:hypothetical protein
MPKHDWRGLNWRSPLISFRILQDFTFINTIGSGTTTFSSLAREPYAALNGGL